MHQKGECSVHMTARVCLAAFSLWREPLSLDIEGNGKYDALTDGLCCDRYMYGEKRNALTSSAIAAGDAGSMPSMARLGLKRYSSDFGYRWRRTDRFAQRWHCC